MTARRPALIFDFGNVVAFFDYAKVGAILGRDRGLSGEGFLEELRARGFADLLKTYESGRIGSEAFGREICRLMELPGVDHPRFLAAWSDIFELNEPVARLVAELKARGYPLVLGSNTNEMHATFYRKRFAEALAPFDRLVLSYEVGHVKPAREFYLACAEAADAEPAGCVFIDDMPENVRGARDAGLRGLLFTGVPDLVCDLIREGVDLPS